MKKQYKLATFLIILCLCFFVTGFNQNIQSKNINVGDYIKFGSYSQTASGQVQPIEWQVLLIENNKMLVISRYGLETRRFDPSSQVWSNSEIRQWLNGEFYNKAFTEQEKKSINLSNLSDVRTTDHVFLLSRDEAGKYFSNNEARKCEPTEYAKKNGADVRNGYIWWWLRSPDPDFSGNVYCVNIDGYIIYGNGVSYADVVVRSALWINL